MSADVDAIVHPLQKEALQLRNLGNLRGSQTELGGRGSLGLGCSGSGLSRPPHESRDPSPEGTWGMTLVAAE